MKPTTAHVRRSAAVVPILALSFPTPLLAMNLNSAASSLLAGAAHPIIEVTHVGALLLLGIAAAQLGRRSAWGLPLMVAGLMAFGIILGMQGAIAPMLDTIVMTVALCLVLLILGKVHLFFALVTSVAGAFALFHGVADGMLMDLGQSDLAYAIGFVLMNVLLMIAGVLLGEWIHRRHAAWTEQARHWRDHLHGFRLG